MTTDVALNLTFVGGKLKYCSDKNQKAAIGLLEELLNAFAKLQIIENAKEVFADVKAAKVFQRTLEIQVGFKQVDKSRTSQGDEDILDKLAKLLGLQAYSDEDLVLKHYLKMHKEQVKNKKIRNLLNLKLTIISKKF